MSVLAVLIPADKLVDMLYQLLTHKFGPGDEKCILKVYTVLLVVVFIGELNKTEYGKVTCRC